MLNQNNDKKLRLELVKHTGFTLDEIPMVYEYINGNNEALSELKEFRQWKREKERKRFESTL